MNYNSAAISREVLPLVVARQMDLTRTGQERTSASETIASARAHLPPIQFGGLETIAWLALALSSLAMVAVSFWI